MRGYSKKLLSAGMILAAVIVAGCASPTPYESVPERPSFTTEQQMAAADACQAVYSCCTRSCSDVRVASNEPGTGKEECVAGCGANLEECYRGCE